jgi:hypothetical protein
MASQDGLQVHREEMVRGWRGWYARMAAVMSEYQSEADQAERLLYEFIELLQSMREIDWIRVIGHSNPVWLALAGDLMCETDATIDALENWRQQGLRGDTLIQ